MSENELIPLVDVARDLGITPEAVKVALRRHQRPIRKIGTRNATTLGAVEWLTRHRERRAPTQAKRPAGWWGGKRAAEELGVAHNTLANMTARGELHPVRVRRSYFYDPQEVRHLARLTRPAPPGWIVLVDLADKHGFYRTSPLRTARSLGLEIRYYPRPDRPAAPPAAHVREEDAALIVARLSLPLSYPGRLTSAQLSAACGLARTVAQQWIGRGLPHLRCRNGFAWIDPVDALSWLEDRPVSRMHEHAQTLRAHLAQQQEAA